MSQNILDILSFDVNDDKVLYCPDCGIEIGNQRTLRVFNSFGSHQHKEKCVCYEVYKMMPMAGSEGLKFTFLFYNLFGEMIKKKMRECSL